jgi:hypothetical protein
MMETFPRVSIESNKDEKRTFEFSAVQRKRKRQAYIERKKANSIVMDVVYQSQPEPDAK